MTRPTLGIACIFKNEAHNLKQLTKSLEGCADQLVCADTGSTDGTPELAKKLGWEVHHFKWIYDFSAARNFAFSFLNTDYALWIDGDDLLDGKEAFIQWRDTVMSSADMWIGTYNYAQDKQGRPVCSHARERVVRLSKGFEWSYPIHEGLKPKNPNEKIAVQMVTSWSIKHVRTIEDLQRDKHRNLEIFEKNKDKLDSRLIWYRSKELFETGDHVESIPGFLEAISDKKLEAHDRLLAIQYLAEAYMKANQPEKAIQIAHQGMQLKPDHAEFYGQVGNCYMMKANPIAAIPYYKAATGCKMQGSVEGNQTGAIFNIQDYYKAYPKVQLAKCLAQLQRFDEAEKEAKEAFDQYGDQEAKAVLSELAKIRESGIEVDDRPRKRLDELVFTIPPGIPYEFDPDLRSERGLGGSETALVEMAKELAALTKLPVKVFTPRSQRPEMVREGVEYIDLMKAAAYFNANEPKLHVAWRHNLPVTKGRTLVWNHDLTSMGIEHIDRYYKALALSPFHKAFLVSMCKVPPEKISVTRNGLAVEDIIPINVKKNPNKILFSSSPDRGLDRAIRVVEMARETFSNLELHVAYGFEGVRKANPGAADTLEKLCSQHPWVKVLGNLKKPALMRHFAESAVWCYPTSFLETSCITAMEALAYGAYPIVRAYGALSDTLKDAHLQGHAMLIDNFAESDEELKVFADTIIDTIREERFNRPFSQENFLKSHSWESVAREWCRDYLEMSL